MIQALSLQVTHLLSKGVQKGSLAAKDLEISLLLEGRFVKHLQLLKNFISETRTLHLFISAK